MMDGTACVTGHAPWRWDDIVTDLGMRQADLAHQSSVIVVRTVADIDEAHRSGRVALVFGLEAATPIENELDRLDVLFGLGLRQIGIAYTRRQRARQRPGRARRRRPDRVRPARGDPHERARAGDRHLALVRPDIARHVRAERPAGLHDPRGLAGGLGHPADEARRGAASGRRDRWRDRHVGGPAHDDVGRAPAALDRVGDGPLPLHRGPRRHRARRVRAGHALRRSRRAAQGLRPPARRSRGPRAGRRSSPSSTSTAWKTRPRTSHNICGWLVRNGFDDDSVRAVIGGNIYRALQDIWITPA